MTTNAYICEDCIYIFVVYDKPKRGRKVLYCPSCGESFAIQPYSSVRKENTGIQIIYKPEEDAVVQRVINKEITRTQAAYLLGRSPGSVRMREKRLKEKKNN